MADVTVLTGATLARTATRLKAVYIGTIGYTGNRGAAGNPVFTFEEDSTTGIYSSAAGVLDFASNGVRAGAVSAVDMTATAGAAPGSSGVTPQVPVNMRLYTVALTPLAVAANTTAEQTFTVVGLTTLDAVFISPPLPNVAKGAVAPGVAVVGARVGSADNLTITFGNFGTVSTTPSAPSTYRVLAVRTAT